MIGRSTVLLALALTACDGVPSTPDASSADAGELERDGGTDAGPRDAGPPPDPLSGIGDVVLVADGFQFLEGPHWRADEGVLVFTDIPASTIHALTPPSDIAVLRMPSGEANGLATLPDGRLLAAEHANRRVSVTEDDGTVVALAESFEGGRFNSPNDLVVRSDGTVYFTDPPYGLTGARELDFNGVFRVARDGAITAEWRGAIESRPNGIALSPDESVLYVADTVGGVVRAYDVAADGSTSGERTFAEGTPNADGMAVDERGNLYVTTSEGVAVLAPDGARWGTIEVPQVPANCAFGDVDRHTLYITARTALYAVRLAVRGI